MTALLATLLVVGGVTALVLRATLGGEEPDRQRPVLADLGLHGMLALSTFLTASGIAGTLDRVTDREIGDTESLARSLAFVCVAGPVTAVLWRLVVRRREATLGWLIAGSTLNLVSLVVASVALAGLVGAWVRDESALDGVWMLLVWGSLLVFVEWATRHIGTRLGHSETLAASYGLLMAAFGVAVALGLLLTEVYERSFELVTVAASDWYTGPVSLAAFGVVGALVWWRYWARLGPPESTLRTIHVIGLGAAAPAAAAASALIAFTMPLIAAGIGTSDAAAVDLLRPLPFAISVFGIAATVLVAHRRLVAEEPKAAREIVITFVAGVGLVAAASGLGVVINALLSVPSAPLAETGRTELLATGIAGMLVGAPLWWNRWSRLDDDAASRRPYLSLVFAVASVVALVSTITLVFRLFEVLLDPDAGAALVDRIRAPVGTLTATALVAGYHYPIWMKARRTHRGPAPQIGRRHIYLVAPPDDHELASRLRHLTKTHVTEWTRSDVGPSDVDAEAIVDMVKEVGDQRILVIAGPGAHRDVIPLN